jgi:alternate F1F0 ATPase, F1 subunit epsilon
MEQLMHLKILLPFRIYAETEGVSRIVLETAKGSYGVLPQRLDCVTALVPGIFMYEANEEEHYIAIDEGILIKAGQQVLVSVRNAVGGASLGQLREAVEKEFVKADESETQLREVMDKMENGLVASIEKLRKE